MSDRTEEQTYKLVTWHVECKETDRHAHKTSDVLEAAKKGE